TSLRRGGAAPPAQRARRGVAARPGDAGGPCRGGGAVGRGPGRRGRGPGGGGRPRGALPGPARAPLRVLRRPAALPGGSRRGTGERAVGAAEPVSEFTSEPSARRSRHRARRRGVLRSVSGVLAAGMVALVGGLLLAYVVALREGAPGPGAATLLVHAVTAALA